MRVGVIGTGAISHKHVAAYRNIGYRVTVCTDVDPEAGRKFAGEYGAVFLPTYEEVCCHPEVDYVDLCTMPDFRLPPVEACAAAGKHIQVQKPMAVSLETARRMIETARSASIHLGVVSQHRFDDASLFLHKALAEGRLGKLLQADAYVKWYRPPVYYSRPIKGSWAVEGGGALLNQGIHHVDLLLWFAGPARKVYGQWQLGALHKIESEDVVSAVVEYESGATGVIQASTAMWPGYPERIELHGTKGTAIITGDRLTTWDVADDSGEPPPLASSVLSGASDPMAIPLKPFERQFRDFGESIRTGRQPAVGGEEGYRALELVLTVYQSCREGRALELGV
ncbi:MAG: Gfo/Idh/MocA family protein [Bryobacteraceae bacterium]